MWLVGKNKTVCDFCGVISPSQSGHIGHTISPITNYNGSLVHVCKECNSFFFVWYSKCQ
jgi:hypothetical protein